MLQALSSWIIITRSLYINLFWIDQTWSDSTYYVKSSRQRTHTCWLWMAISTSKLSQWPSWLIEWRKTRKSELPVVEFIPSAQVSHGELRCLTPSYQIYNIQWVSPLLICVILGWLGPMVWYQKFEYAIGHWLQKAAEHMLGCVLCSPGCFSLFRGSAIMDDNVMRTYATKSTEARHYVQYDQGESMCQFQHSAIANHLQARTDGSARCCFNKATRSSTVPQQMLRLMPQKHSMSSTTRGDVGFRQHLPTWWTWCRITTEPFWSTTISATCTWCTKLS